MKKKVKKAKKKAVKKVSLGAKLIKAMKSLLKRKE